MKKFLVVGVGGSGGATLRYLMDQLRADLREQGVQQLPDAWQFLHIDVNTTPETTEGLGDITKLGGRYVAVGSAGNSFPDVRRTVEARLDGSNGLASLATWVPGSAADTVPVGTGAGQYRAIGRMLTLTRVKDIEAALNQAWQALQRPTSWGGLAQAMPDQAPYEHSGSVVPIVVGSLAGGSGASMFLDVCRIMGRIGGIDRSLLGAFLFTPDVFQALLPDKRKGIDGNAMAALGELIAAQVGASAGADGDLLESLGLTADRAATPPFGRVFPIGSFIGGDGARFGETHEDVYRGIGRALAATIRSEVASTDYLKTRFENPAPLDVDRTRFGWGAESKNIGWASFGYASLSLGRDRYAEYVAQRLARTAVDQLVEGFHDPTSQLLPVEQLDELIDNQWLSIVEGIGLARPGERAGDWLSKSTLPASNRRDMASPATSPFVSWAEGLESMPASEWITEVRNGAAKHEAAAAATLDAQAYRWAEDYAGALEGKTKSEVVRLLSHPRQGLPYARRVLERLQGEVDTLVEGLRGAPTNLTTLLVSEETEAAATALKATASASQELVQRVTRDVQTSADRRLRAGAARLIGEVLSSYSRDVLEALRKAVSQALEALEHARGSTAHQAGLAMLRTTVYSEWPKNSDVVPQRFDHAVNEVLLTSSGEFPAKFTEHVMEPGSGGAFQDNLSAMVNEVVLGRWESAGAERSDFPVIGAERSWRAPALRLDQSGKPTPPSKPIYTLALSTEELLERAHAYQARKGYPFEKFSSQSFEDYLHERGKSDVELEGRRDTFVQKFEEATKQARPLVGVSRPMISAIHGAELSIDLTFGDIPLHPGTAVAQRARQLLDEEAAKRFDRALKPTARVSRIAVFSGYPVYSPLVFTSFLRQLQARWLGESEHGKTELWKHKRARPLPSALAMSPHEQAALITGWYLGRALGLVHPPVSHGSDDPVNVWNVDTNSWLKFEPRLLTPRANYRNPHGFDWLAGVLEGHTLALANTVDDPELSSLRPYEALRRIADGGADHSGGSGPSAAVNLLEAWFTTGAWPSGQPSEITRLTEADPDIESRAEAFVGWLASVREWIEEQWLERTSSFDANATYRLRVDSREHLHTLPLFAEIALPTYDALGELIRVGEKAKARALTGGVGGAAPQV